MKDPGGTMDCDILIIGGGVAGLSAAAEIAPSASVILLEAEDRLAYHASARSAALYEPYYGPPAITELSLASRAPLEEAGVLSARGMMVVASAGQQAAFAANMAAMHLREITADEAAALFPALDPARIALAGHGDHAWDIDIDRLVQSFARAARSHGATIITRAGLTGLQRQGGAWQAITREGAISARMVVNAAGAWADSIARMAGLVPLGLVPHRRSMARIAAPGGLDPAAWPMVFGAGETWYAKPDAGALIVSPADADPVEPHDAWADDMVLAEGLARYEALSRFPVERLLASWAGLRTFSADGTPVYGRDAAEPSFLWFAGQGGYGFQSAPAAARFIADVALGRDVDRGLSALLSPARFAR